MAKTKTKLRRVRTIPLEEHPGMENLNFADRATPIRRGSPFAMSPRGMLIHRTRYATRFDWPGFPSRVSIGYWCGNIGREFVAVDEVGDRYLCHRCESAATARGHRSAETLLGRHVHIGTLTVARLCCFDP